jgi:hypothetical protein
MNGSKLNFFFFFLQNKTGCYILNQFDQHEIIVLTDFYFVIIYKSLQQCLYII